MRKTYLDNGSTSFPKAPGLGDAMSDFITNVGCNVGRGGYESAYNLAEVVLETRSLLCELFNFPDEHNVVFTPTITMQPARKTEQRAQPVLSAALKTLVKKSELQPAIAMKTAFAQTAVTDARIAGVIIPITMMQPVQRMEQKQRTVSMVAVLQTQLFRI